MSRCFCREPKLVTLINGSQVCSCSEAWRHECEAREIAAIWDDTSRMLKLRGIRNRRGVAEQNRIEMTIDAIRKSTRPRQHNSRQASLWG